MTTVKCPTCSKTFTKMTEERAAQALRMHTWRTHTGRVPTATHAQRVKRAQAAGVVLATMDRPRSGVPVDGRRRRNMLVETHVEPACYCPRCGLNLTVLNTAMHVASKMSPA